MTKLSIITVNLNNAEGLRKTIESVVNQTFTDFEYIIIDGGSTDGSVDIIKQYANATLPCGEWLGERLYWVSEPDKGIYNAMNKGILQAKGEYCLFLNSGDWLFDNLILTEVFKENLREDIIYGDLYCFNEKGDKTLWIPSNKWTFRTFLYDAIPHPACFIKRQLFLEISLYDETLTIISDWAFFITAIIIHNKSYIHLPYCISNFEAGGISKFKNKDYMERVSFFSKSPYTQLLLQTILELQKETEEYQYLKSGKFGIFVKLLLKTKKILTKINPR
jgi:glycosyltransferase involved in cell wall biosynthesis